MAGEPSVPSPDSRLINDVVLGTPKPSRPIEEDGTVSPRASKKRRTEHEPEDSQPPEPAAPAADQGPGNDIEQELASALGAGVAEPTERSDDAQVKIENLVESTAPESTSELDPEMAAVISNIMNHAERVEEQCALGQQSLEDNDDESAPKGLVFVKANSHLKTQSLPILDNLVSFSFPTVQTMLTRQSTQILGLLAKSSYQDITAIVSEPESENGQAYSTMRSLFDHTKKVYSTKTSFLSAAELGLVEPAQVNVIRKANLASFVSSIFGSQEIGFAELNDNFLDVFVPEGGRLLKVQGALYLELKTQAFISSMNSVERTRAELLYDLFPDSMEQNMLDRRPGTRQLAPSEIDFINRAKSRRDILLNDVDNEEAMASLPDKYHWEDFLRDLSSYITKNFDLISHPQVRIPLGF